MRVRGVGGVGVGSGVYVGVGVGACDAGNLNQVVLQTWSGGGETKATACTHLVVKAGVCTDASTSPSLSRSCHEAE